MTLDLQIDEISEKYLSGLTTVDLAKEYGYSHGIINRKLRDNGIRIRTNGESKTLDLPVEEICEKYQSGMSLTKLAKEYKCTITPIIKRLHDNNIKIRTIAESRTKLDYKGKNNPNYINLPVDEISEKYLSGISMVEIAKEYGCSNPTIAKKLRDNNIKIRISSKRTLEQSQHISASKQGILYDEWESFASERLYCPNFNEKCRESNRKKYSRMCFLTGLPEEENITKNGNKRKLSVHHVDMDKNQGCNGVRWKLVPICLEWHTKIHNELWEARIIWLLNNVWR